MRVKIIGFGMTLEQIKDAVLTGKRVCWGNTGYEVRQRTNSWSIICIHNQHEIGLTWDDNVTMNGKEEEFFIDGE